jgi:hypothetical protein
MSTQLYSFILAFQRFNLALKFLLPSAKVRGWWSSDQTVVFSVPKGLQVLKRIVPYDTIEGAQAGEDKKCKGRVISQTG